MRAPAGFHADLAGREFFEEIEDLLPAQFPGADDLFVGVDAMNLEDVFGKVNADADNGHDGLLVPFGLVGDTSQSGT